MVIVMMIVAVMPANAQELASARVNQIVNGIYKVEGGARAKSPYGILSVKCKDKEECRKICAKTVKNTWQRWNKAGKPGAFLNYLADRYCPISADPKGNRNWKHNIKKLIKD